MTAATKKKCPKCGETDQTKFHAKNHSGCKACVVAANKNYYQSIKSQRAQLRKPRAGNNDRCIECLDMSVDTQNCFATFCGARRLHKKIGGYHTNCSDCGLGKKVDGGFMPVNISVMEVDRGRDSRSNNKRRLLR